MLYAVVDIYRATVIRRVLNELRNKKELHFRLQTNITAPQQLDNSFDRVSPR